MYIVQILGSDETTQKFGCVMIFYAGFASGETSFLNEPNIQNTVRKVISAFCLRVGAIHICFPNTPTYQFAAAGLSLLAPSIIRVRVRQHLGSLTECKFSLMTYGIPVDQLPITASGRIKTTNHIRWIKTQREREESIQMCLPPFEGVDCPLVTDILIGNTRPSFKHNPGNMVYNDVMDSYYGQYVGAADTQEKMRITWKVLEDLNQAGCRILARDRRGWWTVASTDRAREKIAHDFRVTLKRMSAVRKRSQVNVSTTAFAELDGKRKRMGIACPGCEDDDGDVVIMSTNRRTPSPEAEDADTNMYTRMDANTNTNGCMNLFSNRKRPI